MRCIKCNHNLSYIIQENRRIIFCATCSQEYDYVDGKLVEKVLVTELPLPVPEKVEPKEIDEHKLSAGHRILPPSEESEQTIKPHRKSRVRAGEEKASDSLFEQDDKSPIDNSTLV